MWRLRYLQIHEALPDLTLAEALEISRLHRVAGLTGSRIALLT